MSSIIVRHRASLRPFFRLILPNSIAQGQCHGAQVPRNVNSRFQSNIRLFSETGARSGAQSPSILTVIYSAYSHYPRRLSGRPNRSEDTTRRGKDALTEAQESLENAASAVTEADKRIIKELGHSAPFESYVKLMLSRLRPFLIYFVHHGPERFLKAYAPPPSSMGRARNATLFLFISAHAWFFHAMAARSSGSLDFPPAMVQVAEQFTKAGNAVEAYVENKLPDGMSWADVGGAIVDSSTNAWLVMSKIIDSEDGATARDTSIAHGPSQESPDKGGDQT